MAVCLQQNTVTLDRVRGDQYAFLAVNQDTKLIIHSHLGKRNGTTSDEFLRGLKPRMAGRFQLTSDKFAAYCGPVGGVFQVFRENIDYGYEVKFFGREASLYQHKPRRTHPRQLLKCQRVAVIGHPNRHRMTTNISERTNLSVRLFNRRFTRKTLGYSKTLRNHQFALTLQIAYFNFCRVHSAVKIKATETDAAKERTPAMAQGLTDHVWTVAELLQCHNGAFSGQEQL
jgi:IS1 family transposase